VFLGKATRIDGTCGSSTGATRRISGSVLRYQQGEEYEEDLRRRRRREIEARRTVTIRRGALERVDCPEGTFLRGAAGWSGSTRAAPRLAAGAGAALRAHDVGGGRPPAAWAPTRAAPGAPTNTCPTSPA
jgi:hypothetical protein